MSIISLFSKKNIIEEVKPTPKFICVIFNIVNHASLIAATLYAKVREEIEKENVNIELVDIRDSLPDQKDQYVWVGVNGPELYENYLKTVSSKARNPNVSREWITQLKEKSIIIEAVHSPQKLSLDTLIGRAFMALPGEAGIDIGKVMFQDVFTRFAVLSQCFEQDVADINDFQAYYTSLDFCYSLYHGYHIGLQDLVHLSRSPKADEVEFKMNQKRIAKTLLRKTTPCYIEGKPVQLITTMGPDIYNLIRRIGLAKKAFVHMSYGVLGPVVYSECRDIAAVIDFGKEFSKEAFMLLPKPLTDKSLSAVEEAEAIAQLADKNDISVEVKQV